MSILGVDRDHDVRQDKLFTALIVSVVVHILLFIFFSQLAPLYRTPGLIKKTYEVLLLGRTDTESEDKGLTEEKEEERHKEEEEILKVREEDEVEDKLPYSSLPDEAIEEAPPAPPLPEPAPAPVEAKPEPAKKVITDKPSPVKTKSIPPKEKTPQEKVFEKKAETPEKTVYSSTPQDVKKESAEKAEGGGAMKERSVPAGQSYMELIKALVFKNLRYPPAAKINRIEGDVYVAFLISKKGNSVDVNIKRSSGYPILDDGALRAIKKTEPFPSFDGAEDVSIVHMGNEQYASVSFKISFSLNYITMGAE